MRISLVDKVSDELVNAFGTLIPQLAPDAKLPSKSYLQEIVDSDSTFVFVVQDKGAVVGTLSMTINKIPTGLKVWIEDVVVSDTMRGQGLGEQLTQYALAYAKDRGCVNVNLTSSIDRTAAHRLYQKIGFKKRDTLVYRYYL